MTDPLLFNCGSCGMELTWKKEYVGRTGKCKCGNAVTVPPQPNGQEDDGLYELSELAADAEKATANLPTTIVEPPPAPRAAKTKAAQAANAKTLSPLPVQRKESSEITL